MGNELYQVECDPTCGFLVQSHDEQETLEIARQHAKSAHQMEVSREGMRAKVKTVART